MAHNLNWAAAISDLRDSAAGLEEHRKRTGGRESENEKKRDCSSTVFPGSLELSFI
jgi:hypothetical protein